MTQTRRPSSSIMPSTAIEGTLAHRKTLCRSLLLALLYAVTSAGAIDASCDAPDLGPGDINRAILTSPDPDAFGVPRGLYDVDPCLYGAKRDLDKLERQAKEARTYGFVSLGSGAVLLALAPLLDPDEASTADEAADTAGLQAEAFIVGGLAVAYGFVSLVRGHGFRTKRTEQETRFRSDVEIRYGQYIGNLSYRF
ncbi:MAG: hypothetical protein O2782_21560 [bacterium]|nr:hypothetical protein [bacterium]